MYDSAGMTIPHPLLLRVNQHQTNITSIQSMIEMTTVIWEIVPHWIQFSWRRMIWGRWRCGCLVSWFCYHLIAKPGNKAAAPLQPDPYAHHRYVLLSQYLFNVEWQGQGNNYRCLSRLALTVIGAWIRLSSIHSFLWNVITHPCPNLKLGHGWVITSHKPVERPPGSEVEGVNQFVSFRAPACT